MKRWFSDQVISSPICSLSLMVCALLFAFSSHAQSLPKTSFYISFLINLLVHEFSQQGLKDTGEIFCKKLPCAPSALISAPRLNPTLANHDKVANNCISLHLSFFMIFLSFLPSFPLDYLALNLRSLSCSLFPVICSIDESCIPNYWPPLLLS